MEIPEIVILIVAIVACIFSIASTAIGIQAFNENLSWKDEHKSNFTFLIINLVVSILVLLLSFVGLFLHFKQ
jgi:hypothetical protein